MTSKINLDQGYINDENIIRSKSSEIAEEIITNHLDYLTSRFTNEAFKTDTKPRESVILIDTCALLEVPASQKYLEKAASLTTGRREKIIVPLTVMGELQSLACRNDSNGLCKKAVLMWSTVLEYWKQGLIKLYDSSVNGFLADELFQSLVIAFAREYDITVISQDYLLSQDLLTICRLPSVKGRKITVKKLDASGNLVNVSWRVPFMQS